MCWRKWCLGWFGKAPDKFTQDKDSHHIGMILLHKNRWPALSSLTPQNGHPESPSWICRLRKFTLVGSLSLISLHANITILDGSLIFHSSSNAPSCCCSAISPETHNRQIWPCIAHSGLHSTPTDHLCEAELGGVQHLIRMTPPNVLRYQTVVFST